ncbi:hypothetical protein H2201_008956 [Coniosporium apollinis]|uniref:Uncharacterized protein n=2 Tax=Coniosporium TaxID=2810619 RepID=A0ABQ9NJ21_9PEZI|nr:hypothetical protein H2199_006081 [Cladosporium sp. JES 115]KAJ9654683.1 hypothetical protein H2201_008956 [Coniosporium apollinis]
MQLIEAAQSSMQSASDDVNIPFGPGSRTAALCLPQTIANELLSAAWYIDESAIGHPSGKLEVKELTDDVEVALVVLAEVVDSGKEMLSEVGTAELLEEDQVYESLPVATEMKVLRPTSQETPFGLTSS